MIGDAKFYMIAEVLRNSVSLIMLPIYTRFLTPEDYGTIELLSLLIDVATIIFGARAMDAIFRFYTAAETQNEKNSVLSSSLFLSIFMACIGATVVYLFSENLAAIVFSDIKYANFIALFALSMAMFPLIEIPFAHLRAMQKAQLYLYFSIFKLVIQVTLNIYFIVYLDMHVEGVIYSTLFSYMIIGSVLSFYSIYKSGINISKKACFDIMSFSIPIKIATMGAFFLTFGDRYFLNYYSDLTEVGIYSLGYKFGFIFAIIAWSPFSKMWDTEKYNIYKQDGAVEKYQKTFLYLCLFLFTTGFAICLFIKDLLKIMSAEEFWPAHEIVPIIIVAYTIQCLGDYCNFGIMLKKKTIQIAYAQWIAVIVITLAYFLLIPVFGGLGAAWATLIGFCVRFFWLNKKGKEYYDMKLPWKKIVFIGLLCIFFFLLSLFLPEDIIISIVSRIIIFILFGFTVFMLPIFSKNQKQEIFNGIKHVFLLKRINS